ncbi:MAG: SRPBCC domain-containing protein [Bacteroidota bacterium]|nr:SRPBCC domain-containing protein [Bacteroidota bacterium]
MDTLQPTTETRELSLSRVVNAPVSLVWEVWTQPEHIRHWWGPNGFRSSISQMEVSKGGMWELIMHGPDGTDYPNRSRFREIVKHKRISFDHISDPRFTFTADFTDLGDKTQIDIRMVFESAAIKNKVVTEFGAAEGMVQNVERLDFYLQKGYPASEVTFTRILNADRDLVFKAWTDRGMLSKWWGPKGFSCPTCDFEPRLGGKIYIEMKGPDGTVYPMDGEVVEYDPPRKLRFLSAALDQNRNRLFEVDNCVTLESLEEKTRLTLKVRVNHIKPGSEPYLKGMNEGWSQSLERLLNFVES